MMPSAVAVLPSAVAVLPSAVAVLPSAVAVLPSAVAVRRPPSAVLEHGDAERAASRDGARDGLARLLQPHATDAPALQLLHKARQR